MTRVSFIGRDGMLRATDAADGQTLMEVAVANDIPGIVGECGGSLLCATCHVYVEDGPAENLPERSEMEEDMLDMAEAEVRSSSRLGCQIFVTPAIDGLVVRVPTTARP